MSKTELAQMRNIIVMDGIFNDVMSKLSEKFCFGCEDRVFAASLLVIIMDEKNFQGM